jgi:O-antigen/teichoic acid export membrane protein
MKALWKGGGAYGLANAGMAGSQFVAILVFAAALPPDGFGYVSIFAVLTVVLTIVTGMGLSAAAQQAFFKLTLEDFQHLVTAIVVAVLLLALVLAVVVVVLPEALLAYLNLPRPWVLLALGSATAQVLVQLVQTVLQTYEQIRTYLALVALQVVTVLVAAGTFYVLGSTRWQGALLAQVAAPLLASAWALLVLARSGCLRRRLDAAQLRQALAYGLPLVPHQVAGWTMSMVDRFIIASSLGVAQAGVYSLSFQIAQATNIVSNSFNQALVPVLFRQLADKQRLPGRLLRLNGIYGVGLAVFSAAFVGIFLAVAPHFLSPAYASVLGFTPWLILAFFLLASSRIASNFLLFHGRTGVLALSTLSAAAVSLVANLWLVPAQGLIGACWTSAATFFLLLLVTSWQAVTCHRRST